ncbi:MAG: hypothetical protein PHY79_07565 [Anaerolineae bacterium]|jgi:hypothetical protein|nr:hypothetical protein [Anaerolineae bacterium]
MYPEQARVPHIGVQHPAAKVKLQAEAETKGRFVSLDNSAVYAYNLEGMVQQSEGAVQIQDRIRTTVRACAAAIEK